MLDQICHLRACRRLLSYSLVLFSVCFAMMSPWEDVKSCRPWLAARVCLMKKNTHSGRRIMENHSLNVTAAVTTLLHHCQFGVTFRGGGGGDMQMEPF